VTIVKNPQILLKEILSLGFTQNEISIHTKIPQPTISRILNDPTCNPRWQTVAALQSFLDTVNQFDDENI
jgi:predicted transcriptional regulator